MPRTSKIAVGAADARQIVQSGNQFAPGKIAGASEDDDQTGIALRQMRSFDFERRGLYESGHVVDSNAGMLICRCQRGEKIRQGRLLA